MQIVAAIILAFAIVVGGGVLAVVALLTVRDWLRTSRDIAERRRAFLKRHTR